MAKRIVKESLQKPLGEAYRGTLSTFIVTLMILFVGFFLPMITAKRLEDARRGESLLVLDTTPTEMIIWDLNSINEIKPITIRHSSYSHWVAGYYKWGSNLGTFVSPFDQSSGSWIEVGGTYQYMGVKTSDSYVSSYRNVRKTPTYVFTDADFPEKDKTVDNYATMTLTNDVKMQGTTMRHVVGSSYWNSKHWWSESDERFRAEQLHIYCDFDLDTWIDNEATEINFFWKTYSHTNSWAVLPYVYTNGYLRDRITGNTKAIFVGQYQQVTGNPIIVERTELITVTDLIDINNWVSANNKDEIVLHFSMYGCTSSPSTNQRRGCFLPNSVMIFDCYVSGLVDVEEEKPTKWLSSVDKFSIYMILESIFIIAVGFVMLPQLSIGRLAEMLRLVEKKKN